MEQETKPSRTRTVVLVVLSILPVALTAAAQPFLPSEVPLHYGAGGNPDRWGPGTELFVPAGIVAVLALFITAAYAVAERQQATGREDWLVVNGKMSFPVVTGVIAVIDLLIALYVFMAFQLTDTTLPSVTGHVYVDVLFGIVVLAFLVPALYMLITGKGLSLVNFHPGTSELERKTGADKQQARAIGGLLLFLMAFVIMEFLLIAR